MSWLSTAWHWYAGYPATYVGHAATVNPVVAALGGAALIWAAIKQARTANQQANTALRRHEEQTSADQQRRLTESFSKAVEQIGSEKLEIRLGGIFTLARIAWESETYHWPVMETLSAFVRIHARRAEWESPEPTIDGPLDPRSFAVYQADIAAIVSVIRSREAYRYEPEGINLSETDLRNANFIKARLRNADFFKSHLEGARFEGACLQGANLSGASLHFAGFKDARLEGAFFIDASLQFVTFDGAHLEGARFDVAKLSKATFVGAHLEGANFSSASGVTDDMFFSASGDAQTLLPNGVARPKHWPECAEGR